MNRFSIASMSQALIDITVVPSGVGAQTISADEAQAIAQEAHVYLYPLILMDLTRKQLINLDPKTSPLGGPANAFTHIRAFPTADMRRWFVRTSIRSTRALGSI